MYCNDDEADELVESVTQKVEERKGLWYSDDFFCPHGRECVTISARLVGETASNALVAVKVMGDPNEIFKTASWPSLGEAVPAEIQVRADPIDPDGSSRQGRGNPFHNNSTTKPQFLLTPLRAPKYDIAKS